MNQGTFNIIFLATPIVIGGLIAAINANGINDTTEKVEAWTRKRQQGASVSGGWFSNYIINPILWVIVKFCDWTDGFTHHGLKNGIRIAATLYLIAAWLFILYVAFMIVVGVVITIAILYVVFKVLAGLNNNEQEKEYPVKNGSTTMGFFSTKCDKCGSKDHSTRDCPHGMFSSKCDKCGSTNHATSDCPHGMFSSKCDKCGSTDHSTRDCPHGIFSSKCDKCGSTNHATSNCPH